MATGLDFKPQLVLQGGSNQKSLQGELIDLINTT